MTPADRFIAWAVARADRRLDGAQRVVTFNGDHLFTRHAFLWRDEWVSASGRRWSRPPWWRPFNILLHEWPADLPPESFHDHPRWSVTICLKGRVIERTPWGDRLLKPGSIVVRSRKAIHAFAHAPGGHGPVWTLFIVGRRNHWQNTYVVTSRAPKPVEAAEAAELEAAAGG